MTDSTQTQYRYELYGLPEILVRRFEARYPDLPSVLMFRDSYTLLTQSANQLVDLIVQNIAKRPELARVRFAGEERRNSILVDSRDVDLPFMVIVRPEGKARFGSVAKRKVTVIAMGPPTILDKVSGWLDGEYAKAKQASLRYHFMSGAEQESASVVIDDPPKIFPEFYAYMNPSPMVSFQRFMDSTNQLLFLSGEPGTGKTTFLRSMIYEHSLRAAVAYDQNLLKQDSLFINFLTEDEDDILIFEDAEALISGREHDGNTLVTKFLNISDGIIKVSKKKMVFTTNSWKIQNIDPALLRPGRCYGVLEFKSMPYDYAVKAAEVAGLPRPPARHNEYTVAEIFNQDITAWEGPRVGF